jgi:glycosidase
MSLPGATPEGAMMHIAFTLSSRGIPQIYYGDEIGMSGGHDPENRKDFLGFASPEVTESNGIERRMRLFTRQWINLRRSVRALRQGRTIDLHYDDDSYLFGRYFEQDKSLRNRRNSYAVVAFNVSEKEKVVNLRKGQMIGEISIATVLKDQNQHKSYPGNSDANTAVNDKGELILRIPPRSIAIYSTDLALSSQN